MFNFLKKKLKSVVENFSKKAEEEPKQLAIEEKQSPEIKTAPQETKPEPEQKTPEAIPEETKPYEQPGIKAEMEKIRQELKEKQNELKAQETKQEKGLLRKVTAAFGKKTEQTGIIGKIKEAVTTTKISEGKFQELFEELEMTLLENNVALEVIDKIKEDLKKDITGAAIPRGKVEYAIKKSLKESIESLFESYPPNIITKAKEKKPYIIMFIGINGSGKTTTIAKLAKRMQDNNLKCVIAAADTFRAAAIQQLQEHADNLGIKLIKHDYGADPAAVAFDAVKYAEAHGMDAVLIDTAGRLHSNKNLMEEMKKVARVAKPDMKIFVGEAITGNDCVEQARQFNETIGIDGIILAKADVDEKGGAAISVGYVTKKPILFLGTGQDYDDLKLFNPAMVTEGLGLE